MSWFNYYGLVIMGIIMIPNIVYAAKHKDGSIDNYHNKPIVICEQIGRYGCFACMLFNVPHMYFGFRFKAALPVYLCVNGGLCLSYVMVWVLFRNKNGITKALLLSGIPSVIFLFCGIMLVHIPLILFAVLFGINHIFLSWKNAKREPS